MKLKDPYTLRQIADFLQSKFVGDESHLVTGINEIHRVADGDLTFVDVEKYYQKALNSAATTIIINQLVDPPAGKALLISDDPFRDYNLLMEHLQPTASLIAEAQPTIGKNVVISPHAVIGERVELGDDVEIGHHVVIGSDVKIGAGSRIHANVSIYDFTEIGEGVSINAGSVIGGEAFYFKSRKNRKDKMLSKGRVIIGDFVDIGSSCTIDRGVSADTTIGDWTKIDNLVQVGHDTIIGKRCVIAAQVGIAGVVNIEDDVTLWGQVGVVKDLTIGKGAQLFGKTGVMSDLEGGKTYLGMIADEARSKLREVAAIKKLPQLLREWEKFKKDRGL
ncbi:MAG: UDP-3-O-(3-hydroxymyristoyl)glucosamine N-acyltransferase [Bacteroidota bacterium]